MAVSTGPVRFTELERRVAGISRRMLTLNLRKLERDGLLERTVYPTVPPRVAYALTPIAEELVAGFAELTDWAERPSVNDRRGPPAVRRRSGMSEGRM